MPETFMDVNNTAINRTVLDYIYNQAKKKQFRKYEHIGLYTSK